MKLDVGTIPQVVNAEGLQADSLLYNAGPDTLFVDVDGTVSALLSIPIPPLSYIPWPYGNALWVVSRGKSQLVITPTNAAPGLSDFAKHQRIFQLATFSVPGPIVPWPFPFADLIPITECSSFKSLMVSMSVPASSSTLTLDFYWYDSDGNYLNVSRYSSDYVGRPVRITVPVEGSFVSVRMSAPPTQLFTNITLSGITDERTVFVNPEYGDAVSDTLGIPYSITSGPYTPLAFGADYASFTWGAGYPTVSFKSIKQRLRIALTFQAGALPSVAGGMQVRALVPGSVVALTDTLAIPVSTRFHVYDVVLPLSAPCSLTMSTNPTAAQQPNCAFVWY